MSEERCCGNCCHFKNESASGNGWCEEQEWITNCDKVCKCHEPNNNGWAEITLDNVDEVYGIQVNRLSIAWVQGGMTVCRMLQDMSPTLYTMAKIGGYYYMELPELKIDETK